MPQVVRQRIVPPHGRPPAPQPPVPPLPERFRSLADREAVQVLHRAARVLVASLPALTDRLVEALYAQEPGYRAAIDSARAEVWQEVHHSLRHNVGSLLQPREFREPAHRTSRWIGEIRAEQGVPLDAVLHAFRMGGAMVWQGLVDETARRDADDVRLLVHVAADVWNFVDEHCGIVADAYRQAERRLAWRRGNRQRLMVAALLDGTARIVDLAEASAMLGLPEQGRYAVLAVAAGPGRGTAPATPDAPGAVPDGPGSGPDGPGAAPGGSGSAVRPPLPLPAAAGAAPLWHPGPDAEFAILPLTEEPGELSALAAGLDVPPGVRAGIGSAVEGLAALGEARRTAETALRACPATGGAVLLDEHLPDALVVSCPDLAGALADRVLGPLDRLDPADRDVIVETLTAWLDADGSAQRAGARLYCHRNTVLNRLRRFEQLTGRCLTRPRDAVEISLALAARRLRGA
ncbi:PucR family transcriptional regulator [Streptomyces sp. NPDC015501]|uniref:PucR family transcriptional regulator n=1 Tax=unclassified Streptomyces TaxID=2593676 RepID=UPI001274F21A|nr:PucR family transcriptional regulator [Streptomyces griseus subsp. griseus]